MRIARRLPARLLPALVAGVLGSTPALAQPQSLDPLTTLPMPLLAGEQLMRVSEGCHVIVPPGTKIDPGPAAPQWRWYGACRAGLADGPGYFGPASAAGTGQAAGFAPVLLRFGRPVGKPPEPRKDVGIYRRGPLHDADWYFRIANSLEEVTEDERRGGYSNVLSLNGESEAEIIGRMTREDDAQKVTTSLWILKRPCPSVVGYGYSVARSLAEHDPPLSPEQQKQLRPYCEKAYAGLKAEPMNRGQGYVSFDRVSYGYYFIVYVTRDVAPMGPGGLPGSTEKRDVTLCPAFLDVRSCEPIWRAGLAPFIQAREAERKKEDDHFRAQQELIASQEVAREALAAPLEAAWRRRMAELTQVYARRAAEAPAAPKPPSAPARKGGGN